MCRNTCIRFHATSSKVIQRLTNFLQNGKTLVDMSGKQNRPHVLLFILKIENHISSFPNKYSHYSLAPCIYLDSSLSVFKMHELFVLKHPNLKRCCKVHALLETIQVLLDSSTRTTSTNLVCRKPACAKPMKI